MLSLITVMVLMAPDDAYGKGFSSPNPRSAHNVARLYMLANAVFDFWLLIDPWALPGLLSGARRMDTSAERARLGHWLHVFFGCIKLKLQDVSICLVAVHIYRLEG
jgi:hypothetical protein